MTNIDTLRGSVALVTGASSGIGRAVATAFAQAGLYVVAAARRMEVLDALVADIRVAGGRAIAVRTDVRDPLAVAATAQRALDEYGKIDILVANAGLGCHSSVIDASDTVITEIFETNVLGIIHSVKAVLPHMRERRKGHIFTLSSAATKLEWPNDSLYASTKAAVSRFAVGLRNELREHGIYVTDVIPGVIETPLTEALDSVRKIESSVVANAILRCLAAPQDVLIVPRWYRLLFLLHQIAPHLVDRVLSRPK